MALSRRDWNNVIIYSVLAMLVLFYFAPQHLQYQQQQANSTRLVAADQLLLQIQFPQVSLQQAAGVWRFQPAQATSVVPEKLAQSWLQLQVLPTDIAVERPTQPLRTAALVLAGAAIPQQWWLFLEQERYLLQRQGQSAVYVLTAEQAEQLFPESLFSTVAL